MSEENEIDGVAEDKENQSHVFAGKLLGVAESDCKAARVLWESKNFPQSVFFAQQAIEKANKAMGLLLDQLGPGDLKKMGHGHDRFIKKQLVSAEQSVDLAEAMNTILAGKVVEGEVQEIISFMKNFKSSDFHEIEEKDLKEIIDSMNTPLEKQSVDNLLSLAAPNGEQLSDDQLSFAYQVIQHSQRLGSLGLLLGSHCEACRYPTMIANEIVSPLEKYRAESAIVGAIPQIVQRCEEILQFLKQDPGSEKW